MILGMGKDAPARPAPQAEAEKVEKSPAQDKKAERQKRLQSAGAVPRGLDKLVTLSMPS